MNEVTKTITEVNDATEWIQPTFKSDRRILGLSIIPDGSWDGTIELQITSDDGDTIRDLEDFITTTEKQLPNNIDGDKYRLICTAFTAGTVSVRLYH